MPERYSSTETPRQPRGRTHPVFEDSSGQRARRVRLAAVAVLVIIGFTGTAALASIATSPRTPRPMGEMQAQAQPEQPPPFPIKVLDASLIWPPKPCEKLRGVVYADQDRNGARQPEEDGVQGLAVSAFDAEGTSIGEATSDENGEWALELTAATLVRVELTSPNRSMLPGPRGVDTAPFTSTPSAPNCRVDVGIVWHGEQPTQSHPATEVGDRVWADLDCDGLQDLHEPGLARVPVELRDAADELVAWTVTNSAGEYRFGGLGGGQRYQIMATMVKRGYDPSPTRVDLAMAPADGPADDVAVRPRQSIDSDGVPTVVGTAIAEVVTDPSGASDHSIDFGWVPTTSGASEGCPRTIPTAIPNSTGMAALVTPLLHRARRATRAAVRWRRGSPATEPSQPSRRNRCVALLCASLWRAAPGLLRPGHERAHPARSLGLVRRQPVGEHRGPPTRHRQGDRDHPHER